MRKTSILLSILVLFAMVLAACGAEETTTPNTDVPPITAEVTATDDMTATEAPTMEGTATDEPGVPVTGEVNPARVSNQLDFTVWTQDGKQVGEVEDMILDLDNRSVAYVIVGTGGFLEIGEKEIAVPWESLELQTGMSTGGTGTDQSMSTPDAGTGQETATPGTGGTGTESTATPATGTGSDSSSGTGMGDSGQQNAFILLVDEAAFTNAPEFDASVLPQMGQSAGDWDVDINSYWQGGGTGTDSVNTPAPDGTTVPEGTATATGDAGTTQTQATATVDAGQGQDQGTGQGQTLQGVMLASEVLGSTVTLSPGQGQGQGQGQDQATADPNATIDPNATATTEGTGQGQDQGQGVGNITATVEDLIVDIDAGDIQYIVLTTALEEGERWIPVPLGLFQLDATSGAFLLNVNPSVFRDAPFFEDGQFPDTTMSGWNSEFDTFWQNNGSGNSDGSGGADATPTP